MAGVNRIGNDFYNNAHDGCSAGLIIPEINFAVLENTNGIEIVTLSKDELEAHKERYPFWKDSKLAKSRK
jgi:hypothetical protein